MISVFAIIILVFSYYTSETDGQKGIVPYEFCEMYYWTDNLYVTNYTINDSDFITAEAVMDFIQNSTSFQEYCNNRMLIFTRKRFISTKEVRLPERQEYMYSVFYNITIKVNKTYLFNKSLLNDSLAELISLCTIQGVAKAIFDKPQFKEYLTLTLNVSGRLLKIMIEHGTLGPSEPTCNIEEPVCPTRSKVINNTCVCQSGSYLPLNTTTCHPCLLHSYQDKTGQINCIRCPDGKITANISSSSLDDCIKNCTQGLYYNYTSETCVQCPLGKYQPSTGQDKCKKCPPGTITHEIGSVYLTLCTNCTSGSYYDKRIENCISCPKNTFQDLFGAMECEPCPAGKVTSSPGAMTRADCVTEKDLPDNRIIMKIALSITAIVVVVVLIIAIKLIIDRRRIKELMKKFEKNFEVYENPYLIEDPSDEERDIEHCNTTLGDLKEQVLEKELEIPRDYIKFTGVRLGRGNFGEVHQVLVKKPDEPEILCAAKMSKGGSHVTVQDMLEELDTHLKLEKNPNIINLLGVCSGDDGPFYLLIEYCDNGCLGSFLKEHKRIPEYVNTSEIQGLTLEWKLQRSLEICNGMKYLAHQRIVHRDLAARNILLDHNMVAKVSDFGMAKDVYVKSYYKQSHEGSFPLRWMAIESIEGLSFTEKTDVWSFGVLLWEILTDGNLPYYYIINDEKVAQFILTGKKLKRPSSCPKSLYSIVLKCWSDKDYNRPKFRDLYEELNLYMENEHNPVSAETTVDSFKKRFNETKRSVSRRLSRRRTSRNSQISTTKRTSRKESQDIDSIDSIDNGFELDDVPKSSKWYINDASSPKESNDNPVIIVSYCDQEGGISTDVKNEKNIDAGMNMPPEQCLKDDYCKPNETCLSTELN